MLQEEADALLAMPKRFRHNEIISLPAGARRSFDLLGPGDREVFLLDLWRGTIRLTKYKYQTRARITTVLARLDVNGAPHTNPDGSRVGGTHLHLYRAGFEVKWAFELDPNQFSQPHDSGQTFGEFCRYCNVTDSPLFQGELL
jgi:Family of unknown function (DUF6978)